MMTTRVREPAAAGSFYPGSATALVREVDGLLRDAAHAQAVPGRTQEAAAGPPGALRGLIVPHAGYRYSGPVAATAYALALWRGLGPQGIVILGPSHFWPLAGAAVPSHSAWRIPLGDVPIDALRRERALAVGCRGDDVPHASEHSIEVQLPFVQRLYPGVAVLPVAVGEGPPEVVASALAAILDADTLLIVSTDLSHYLTAAAARRVDARTAAAIEDLDHAAISENDACGCHPLRAALVWARSSGLGIRLLDLRNSADTAGAPDRVVGYGAFAIERPIPA